MKFNYWFIRIVCLLEIAVAAWLLYSGFSGLSKVLSDEIMTNIGYIVVGLLLWDYVDITSARKGK